MVSAAVPLFCAVTVRVFPPPTSTFPKPNDDPLRPKVPVCGCCC
jgi:hypothetical protein